MLRRIWALTQKEFIQWIRDRRTIIAILIAPSLELLLFSAAIHTQVKHIPMVVADYSMSAASRSYLDAFVVTNAQPAFLVFPGVCFNSPFWESFRLYSLNPVANDRDHASQRVTLPVSPRLTLLLQNLVHAVSRQATPFA